MTEILPPILKNDEVSESVLDAVFALFDRWQLHELNQAALLGVDRIDDLKQNHWPENSSEVLEKMGHLLAIDQALLKYFPCELTARDLWILVPRKEFADESPLAVMLEYGLAGMRKVRIFAESLTVE
jgi:hypothetical protein